MWFACNLADLTRACSYTYFIEETVANKIESLERGDQFKKLPVKHFRLLSF